MNEEGLDIAVLVGHLPSSSLNARQVGHVRSIVCGSPACLATHGEPDVPQDLKRHQLIATKAHRDKIQWCFQAQGEPNNIKVRSRFSCATVQAAIDTAALSYPLFGYLNSGRLKRVLQPFELPALPVHVVYRERRRASMRGSSFVDDIVDELHGHPALRTDAL